MEMMFTFAELTSLQITYTRLQDHTCIALILMGGSVRPPYPTGHYRFLLLTLEDLEIIQHDQLSYWN
jgi:hypothetical protein